VDVSRIDVRSLSREAQQDLRRRVVRAVKNGMTQVHAAEVFDVSVRTVSRWVNAERRGGDRALRPAKPGRRPEEQKALSKAAQRTVCRTIVSQSPAQAGGDGVRWTRAAVAELIARRFGVRLSHVSCGTYLRRWGLSPQKPIRRAYEKDPAKVRTWLEETYPQIVARARAERGIVVWLDESGVGSADAPGSAWAPVGATPVLGKSGQRFRINLMAALTNRGALAFTVYEGSPTIEIYTRFLDRLTRHHGCKVHLIVDQHPTHKATAVKTWLAEHAEQIEQHFLPGYSPELNPVELLNGDTKKHIAAQAGARNRRELTSMIRAHLHRRQKQPALLAALFHKPEVAYAAA
jgi:transposase